MLHLACVRERSLPGWMKQGAGALLVLPIDSVMRRHWTWPALTLGLEVGAANETVGNAFTLAKS